MIPSFVDRAMTCGATELMTIITIIMIIVIKHTSSNNSSNNNSQGRRGPAASAEDRLSKGRSSPPKSRESHVEIGNGSIGSMSQATVSRVQRGIVASKHGHMTTHGSLPIGFIYNWARLKLGSSIIAFRPDLPNYK